MRLIGKNYLLLATLVMACDAPFLNGRTRNAGTYSTIIDAQNGAVDYLLKKYNSIPADAEYKVRYKARNATPTQRSENVLWYNKNKETLSLELDPGSGYACRWTQVSRAVLEQASKLDKGITVFDSLAKPEQPIGQCQ